MAARKRALCALPVPPLQQLGIMLRFRRVVDGAAKHVEHAAIHVLALAPAQLGVKRFGIAAAKRGDVGDAEAAQIGGDRGADAGDPL